jgi:hypothetical protein
VSLKILHLLHGAGALCFVGSVAEVAVRVPSATRYVPVPCSFDEEMVRDTERWSRQARICPQVTLGLSWIGAAALLTGGGWERAGVAHLGEPVLRAGLAVQRHAAMVLASGAGAAIHIVRVSG